MRPEDPWHWDEEDLVAELCYSKNLYQVAGYDINHAPDLKVLEEKLREKKIKGATFLTVLDVHTLQPELGLHELPQRVSLTTIIQYLRRQSHMYKELVEIMNTRTSGHQSPSSSHLPGSSSSTGPDQMGILNNKNLAHLSGTPLQTCSPTMPTLDEESSSRGGQWDHLLRWQNYGNSDEVDFDKDDSQEDIAQSEFEDGAEYPNEGPDEDGDEQESVQGQCDLSEDQIVEIINERIAFYTENWRPNKDATASGQTNSDPTPTWEEAEALGKREQFVKKYKDEENYFRERLDQLCEQVRTYPGRSARMVRQQCRNFEVTIDSLSRASWLLSIYSSDHAGSNIGTVDHELLQGASSSEDEDQNAICPAFPTEGITYITREEVHLFGRARTPDSVISGTPFSARLNTPEADQLLHPSTLASHGDDPEHASIATVCRWKWTDLVHTQDRKRIVSKVVEKLTYQDLELLRARLKCVNKAGTIREIKSCIEMLLKNEHKMQGVLPGDLTKILILTRLFLSWWFCDNYSVTKPSKSGLEGLQQCLENGASDLNTFCNYLNTIMMTTFSEDALMHPELPSQAEIIEISDDDD